MELDKMTDRIQIKSQIRSVLLQRKSKPVLPGSEYEEARIEYTMRFFSTLVPVKSCIDGVMSDLSIGFLHDISNRYSAVLLNDFGSFLWTKGIITQENKLEIDDPYNDQPLLRTIDTGLIYPYITIAESEDFTTIAELLLIYHKELK